MGSLGRWSLVALVVMGFGGCGDDGAPPAVIPDAPEDGVDVRDATDADTIDAGPDGPTDCATGYRLCEGECDICPGKGTTGTTCEGNQCAASGCVDGFERCKDSCCTPNFMYATAAMLGTTGSVHTSIALDSADSPVIAFHDPATRSLMVATMGPGGFSSMMVDAPTGTTDSQGWSPSLAIDGMGVLHIAYQHAIPADPEIPATRDQLKYARLSGGSWIAEVVAPMDDVTDPGRHIALAIDSNDQLHIVFSNQNQHLGYARRTGGASWTVAVADPAGSTGRHVDLAIDGADTLHASYQDWSAEDLRYARRGTGAWTLETLESGGATGSHSAISAAGTGYLYIAFNELDGPRLQFMEGSPGSFIMEPIEGGLPTSGTELGVDSRGYAAAAYRAGTEIHLARHEVLGWIQRIVSTSGASPSLAVDGEGHAHIAYSEGTMLIYARSRMFR